MDYQRAIEDELAIRQRQLPPGLALMARWVALAAELEAPGWQASLDLPTFLDWLEQQQPG